ncbi:MAG: hypothetical protein CBC48_10790 [bacterium TMED88]|nr:hypothetical protein [Deltaproteobacteria bacterium]OUV30275.1 MAG: hypothetical protein CBC48_10790 [bacterium TMED88]
MNKNALITLCLVVAVDAASFGLLLPVVPFLVNQLTGSFNPVSVTGVLAAYSGLQFIGAPIIGRLSDRHGRRKILTITVAISGIALIGSGLAQSLLVLLLFQGLNGASSGVFAIAQAVVADSVSDLKQRTVSFGALGASLGIGFVIGPGVGGVIGAIDPKLPFFVAAGFCLLNVLLIRLRLTESRPVSDNKVDVQSSGSLLWGQGQAALRRLISVYFLFYLGFNAFNGIFVLAAKDRFNWGPQPSGLVLVYVGVVSIIVQGALLPNLLKRFRAERLSVIGLTLVGAAMLGVSGINHGYELYITQLLFAGGVGLSTPGLRSSMSICVNENQQGALGGITQSVISLTSLFGPLLSGQLYGKIGYEATFQAQAVIVLVAMTLLVVSNKRPINQAVKTPSA